MTPRISFHTYYMKIVNYTMVYGWGKLFNQFSHIFRFVKCKLKFKGIFFSFFFFLLKFHAVKSKHFSICITNKHKNNNISNPLGKRFNFPNISHKKNLWYFCFNINMKGNIVSKIYLLQYTRRYNRKKRLKKNMMKIC